MTTTTALVLNQLNGPFSFETVKLDTLRPDEALVEIHASGICHTDLACADGTLPAFAPAVLGHEGAGIVLRLGSQVENVAVGDKVLLSFSHCRDCRPCKAGHPANCHLFKSLNFGGKRPDGSSVMHKQDDKGGHPFFSRFFGQSSFSRHAVVSMSSLVKVPSDTDLALFAPLGCGLQTGAGAVLNTLDVQAGSSVAVFGAGSVGMSAIMAAKMRRAGVIIAIDLQQSRLDLASQLGATHTVLGNAPDILAQIRQLAPPNGVDYAVDCTGVPAVIETMIEALGSRGHAASVGAPTPGKKTGVDIFAHVVHGRRYSGCCEGDSIIPYLMEEYSKGNYPVDKLVTFYDFGDFQQAIDDTKRGTALKAVLVWKE
ncbi:alcohol dehydrogenase [Metarhizium album ARSEF 1941]|uniref:Alcohol dehydrogenase n=1 Tax=Metarhizium album (strain ARSEF 1941) TaxID=1081103 RepID=A0A0B2WKD8_METAS|nr:alcohol dehydrogenase [Metarhizium album ARSEF 1941]KHN93942.1 alcohol dehydrogenase [Metarhizium album ARSEF 1941]